MQTCCGTSLYSTDKEDLDCEAAAENGQLEVLKWARSQDPPYSLPSTCSQGQIVMTGQVSVK